MTTRPYSDCLAQALALCGVPDANTTEVARVKTFINRRARQAYAESELWPRWLVVGEERIVSEEGLLPYSEVDLRDIGTILRIHESEPFKADPAGEYVDWNAQDDGIQITNYQPSVYSGYSDYIVDGSLNPNLTGRYSYYETSGGGARFRNTGNSTYYLVGQLLSGTEDTIIRWLLLTEDLSALWTGNGDSNDPVQSAEETTSWTTSGTASGDPDITKDQRHSAFITYKAAFSTTYGTGDDEEDEVPEEWFEWMATGAAASFLFSDKETESALLLEAQAQQDLDQQLAKISRQNGAHLQTRILSHGNMQAR